MVAGLLAAGPLFAPGGEAAAGVPVTITFASPGEHAFTVPAGVTAVTIAAVGARGGNAGGSGATVTGSVAVTSGSTYYVHVARGGAAPTAGGGAGGGASDVASCGSADAGCVLTGDPATDPRLIVAAGGGGGAAVSGSGAAAAATT